MDWNPQINAHIVAVCDLDRQRAHHAKLECENAYAENFTDRPRPDDRDISTTIASCLRVTTLMA